MRFTVKKAAIKLANPPCLAPVDSEKAAQYSAYFCRNFSTSESPESGCFRGIFDCCFSVLNLRGVQMIVIAVLFDQLRVAAALGYALIPNIHDTVAVFDRRKAVRDDERRSAL